MPGECNQPLKVGGQAVMEGVMMRSPKSFAVAVRRTGGEIVVRESPWRPILGGVKILRWPFIRGSVVLLESMLNGISALNFSAKIAMADLEIEEAAQKAAQEAEKKGLNAEVAEVAEGTAAESGSAGDGGAAEAPVALADSGQEKAPENEVAGEAEGGSDADAGGDGDPLLDGEQEVSDWVIWGTVIFALALGVGLFIALPHLAVWLGSLLMGRELSVDEILFHLIVGGVKLMVFVGYISLISLMKDVRRVFMYHGAEHQSIYTFEAGQDLTVENAARFQPMHPRCGTTFLIMVIALSILVFSLVFPTLIYLVGEPTGISWLDHILYILLKLPLLFPIAGLAYEFQRLTSRFLHTWWAKALAWPGMFIQRLTTRPPSADQLEVALASLRKALWREKVGLPEDGSKLTDVQSYSDYETFCSELDKMGAAG